MQDKESGIRRLSSELTPSTGDKTLINKEYEEIRRLNTDLENEKNLATHSLCHKHDRRIKTDHSHIISERQVLILYTGGTFGMIKGENGLTPRKNFLFEYMFNHPNLCDKDFTLKYWNNKFDQKEHYLITPETISDRRIFYRIFEYSEIIDSSNMNLTYWKMIGSTIKEIYHKYDAFLILHGTDTMHHTASALSFMLENLNKPVIITGSQIPLIEMRNDALKNLIDGLTIAGTFHIPEVGLMFNSKLFRGNRTIKNDILGLDAFESPNMRPLVETGINIQVHWDLVLPPPTEDFSFFEEIESEISIVKFFPIINDSIFETFFSGSIRAVIIETYGPGNLPSNRVRIIEIVKDAIERGIVIVNVSQCRKGGATNYEGGKFFEDLGVISAGDMTTECCMAKLSYLLGKRYDNKKLKKMFQENLRGEISPINKEMLSMHSDRFVEALIKMIHKDKKTEESYIIASSLLPTVINELVDKNNIKLLKKLKKIIKYIHFRDFTKKNPLHISARNGNMQTTRFLLKCHVNINELDEDKFTPLNLACMNKNKKVAMYLKDQGAILNHTTELSEQFCFYAKDGDLEAIELFYKCGANLTMCDYDKRTLAHIAASDKQVNIIRFLVEKTNINIMVSDRWGQTPYDEGNDEIKEIINIKYKVDKTSKKKSKKSQNETEN